MVLVQSVGHIRILVVNKGEDCSGELAKADMQVIYPSGPHVF